MPETLTSEERDFALDREAAFHKFKIEIAMSYAAAPNKASVTDFAQIYVDEHDLSNDCVEQGRTDAYQDFLRSFGRLTN